MYMSSRHTKRVRNEIIPHSDINYDLTTREMADVFGVSKTTIVRVLNDE